VKIYLDDTAKASAITTDKWFRPPFGRLRFLQYYSLKKKYRIVFWDIMPYDFDTSFGNKKSLEILKNKIRPGSIIVFHFSSLTNSSKLIEEFILFARDKGYCFVNTLI
jgi:peptidoglycan/xylan/chitin deacetylase (PgdA/CDA1 family)